MAPDLRERLWKLIEEDYLEHDEESFLRSMARHLEYTRSKTRYTTTELDCYASLALAIRDRLIERWNDTNQTYFARNVKRVYYLSLEFLMGRTLDNAVANLAIAPQVDRTLAGIDLSFEELLALEPDAGLGNGGLGRLAACFLDSMATLQLPGEGYGIRYDYGIFAQDIVNGHQVERADRWLRFGYPWEIHRPEYEYTVHFNGKVIRSQRKDGSLHHDWVETEPVHAVAYDIPIPAYGSTTVNTLRLWHAMATHDFSLADFNRGDYIGAVESKIYSETISSVLYPKDDLPQGKELRLKQEFFFVSATIQDIIRRHLVKNPDLGNLPDKVAIQLNDTHPALAVAELMRLLIDQEGMGWEQAWELCVPTFAYTNHTIMPEALEVWSVELLGRLLPRHLELIYEINHRFLRTVRDRFPNDEARAGRLSIIQEKPYKAVRMANLAVVSSHTVNGVSALHTELLKERLFADFHQLWPDKIRNKTNGITPRRWLLVANPDLAELISGRIGEGWIRDLDRLERLLPLAEEAEFRAEWRQVKVKCKRRLTALIEHTCGTRVDPSSLFDVHVKRIHEYKRQVLNVLHILTLYNRLRADPELAIVPRTFVFAGKAAPAYHMAKLIIRLITAVGERLHADPVVGGRIRVVFVPNYGVTLAQTIIPAADLSEQISTAGTEASGTGNMKLSLNGALTIGTLDGANVEIRDAVGVDDIHIFGLTADEVQRLRAGGYDPQVPYRADPELRAAIDLVASGELCPGEPGVLRPIVDSLLGGDPFLVLADYRAYVDCQERVEALYLDPEAWTRSSIRNTAMMGRFSSDRTIRDYAQDIWGVVGARPDTTTRG